MVIEKELNNYYNFKYIDINTFLSNRDKEIIQKLKIPLYNELYTLYQYELLMQKILLFYKDEKEMSKEELKQVKSLYGTGVSRKEFNNLYQRLEETDIEYIL